MDITLVENQNYTMNNYLENISTSAENNRNSLRRIARNDDTEFSHQSILNVMDKFVKTVNKMDETILVPCRMMEQKVGDESDPSSTLNPKSKSANTVHQILNSADLFEVYSMLNGVKEGLLWGSIDDKAVPEKIIAPITATVTKGHIRRPSSVSVASTNSSTLSDTDSESGVIENDSGIDEVAQEGKVDKIAQDFRRHLHGLTHSLRQMTEAAQYVTWRYQYDIGGPI